MGRRESSETSRAFHLEAIDTTAQRSDVITQPARVSVDAVCSEPIDRGLEPRDRGIGLGRRQCDDHHRIVSNIRLPNQARGLNRARTLGQTLIDASSYRATNTPCVQPARGPAAQCNR